MAAGGASLWSLDARGDDDGGSSTSSSTNAIAFHDRNSSRYNDHCLNCHAAVLTEAPVVSGAAVTNPRLQGIEPPPTRTAHGTMLRGNFKPGETGHDTRCQFCHRSVNVVEGPRMPQDALQGAIRKRVDPAVCTLCHGPRTGGQPGSPGPQFYQVGLLQAIPLSDPLAGQKLYGLVCAGCHDPLANSEVRQESASEIQKKINENEGGMGSLRVLTAAQIQAIATALAQ
jgi:cytochrome c5